MKNNKFRNIFKILLLIILIITILSAFIFYIINNQRQRTVKEMANKILSAAEHYAISQIMSGNMKDTIINFPDNDLLEIRGNLPKDGYIKIMSDSRIEILYHYNGYCVSKTLDEFDNSFKKISKDKCLNN